MDQKFYQNTSSLSGRNTTKLKKSRSVKGTSSRGESFTSDSTPSNFPSSSSFYSSDPADNDEKEMRKMADVSSRGSTSHDVDDDVTLTDFHYNHVKFRRGKLVTFYRNGDPHFKGLRTSVSNKMFATLETLLAWLNEKISTTAGVKFIFSLPEGAQMRDISHFIGGRSYVVSSVNKIIHVPYGDVKERFWRNRSVEQISGSAVGGGFGGVAGYQPPPLRQPKPKPILPARQNWQTYGVKGEDDPVSSARTMSENNWPELGEGERFSNRSKMPTIGGARRPPPLPYQQQSHQPKQQQQRVSPLQGVHASSAPSIGTASVASLISSGGEYFRPKATSKPRILMIRSNTDRKSQQKVIFNPYTSQSYEDVLIDIRSMIDVKYPPVTAIFTATPPFLKVMGLSHLARDLKDCNEFIACGREALPMEMQPSKPSSKNQPSPRLKPTLPFPATSQQSSAASTEIPTERKSMRVSKSLDRLNSVSVSNGGDDLSRTNKTFRVVSNSPSTPSRMMKPFRKIPLEFEVKKVYIHGNLREFYAPRYGEHDLDPSKPDKCLLLDWVYGYRGRDARNNLYVLSNGELIYYVGSVAVIYDQSKDKQRHYMEHNEDITCMTVQTDGKELIVATGQLSGKTTDARAHIRIWNPKTMATYAILGKDSTTRGINSVSFSPKTEAGRDGGFVVTVEDGDRYNLSVWDWKNQTIVAKTSMSYDLVIWGTFHPNDSRIIITYGDQHINFWKLFWEDSNKTGSMQGRILRDKQSGIFEKSSVPNYVTSLAFGSKGDVITGDSSGNITVWSKGASDAFLINKIAADNLRDAHQKPVLALAMLEDGTLLSGGGLEIKAWDSKNSYKMVQEKTMPRSTSGVIRTLVPRAKGGIDGSFYVGTTSNVVLQGSLQNKFQHVIQGHSEELWAVASRPNNEPTFVTAGYDQFVSQWNAIRHSLMWKIQVEKPCVSVDYDPSGRRIVIGTTVGRFIILDAETGQHIVSIQVGTESLDVIRFSPDGELLAVGCQDGIIYIYEAVDDFQDFRPYKSGCLKGHQNYISHMDWSKNGHNLQSVSGDYDLLFWSVDDMKEIPGRAAKDTIWLTQTCTLGYDVLGPWTHLKEGEDINTVCRSSNGLYLAVGVNRGTIGLYSYPSISERPDHDRQKICTGNVTKVTFVYNDKFLITSGSSDAATMQWSLVDNQ